MRIQVRILIIFVLFATALRCASAIDKVNFLRATSLSLGVAGPASQMGDDIVNHRLNPIVVGLAANGIIAFPNVSDDVLRSTIDETVDHLMLKAFLSVVAIAALLIGLYFWEPWSLNAGLTAAIVALVYEVPRLLTQSGIGDIAVSLAAVFGLIVLLRRDTRALFQPIVTPSATP